MDYFFMWEGAVLAGWAFGLCMVWPAKIRGSLRTCVGIKSLPYRYETPSRRSLWRAVTRPPLLQFRAWLMEKAALQTSQNLVMSRVFSPYIRKRASHHSCAPSSVPYDTIWLVNSTLSFYLISVQHKKKFKKIVSGKNSMIFSFSFRHNFKNHCFLQNN